ncbi:MULTISPECIES: ABC transporter permease [unclassified Rhizobium]|uniref:ABC transporter permease n=1 Tax=unclassified Rhizobium TaxID=2613769 RepID=UPI001780F052|nr:MULTISPECIES: ABC transporter permease [unclassified Rhizobium]MBD8688356.1 ABC transporter permease [Rhizobium sp. CFBP 13644]MBD8692811.1 ABC transporter permease [Rhizobium sp. CFBP 13717]
MNINRFAWVLASGCMFLVLIGIWKLVTDANLITPVFLPSPSDTFASLWAGFFDEDIRHKFFATVMRMFYGWVLASIAGIAIGALVGSSKVAQSYLGPSLEALRPLPASAIIPVAMALFGLSDLMVLSVVAFCALWPMLLSTIHGFRMVEPRLFEVARVFRMSRTEFAFKIALPSAMPDILSGARISLTASLGMAVAGEMLVGVDGIGQFMLAAGRSYRSADMFAGLVMLSMIGMGSALLLGFAERKILRWRSSQQ